MKKQHVFISLALCGILFLAGCSAGEKSSDSNSGTAKPITSSKAEAKTDPNEVISSVNNDKITIGDFKKQLALDGENAVAQYGKDIWTYPVNENQTFREYFKQMTLEQMISERLIDEQAKKKNVSISDEEFKKVKDSFNEYSNKIEGFKDALKAGNVDDAFIDNTLRTKMVVNKFLKEYGDSQEITNEEIKKYYESHEKDFKKEEVKASHILFKTTNSDEKPLSADEITKKKSEAEAVLKRVKAGEDFATLAKEFSEDGSASQGGDLGYNTDDKWVPEFSKAAFALKPGETSGIVQSVFGFHIIKCDDKKTTETSLAAATPNIKAALLNEKVAQYVKDLNSKATIKTNEELLKTIE